MVVGEKVPKPGTQVQGRKNWLKHQKGLEREGLFCGERKKGGRRKGNQRRLPMPRVMLAQIASVSGGRSNRSTGIREGTKEGKKGVLSLVGDKR